MMDNLSLETMSRVLGPLLGSCWYESRVKDGSVCSYADSLGHAVDLVVKKRQAMRLTSQALGELELT